VSSSPIDCRLSVGVYPIDERHIRVCITGPILHVDAAVNTYNTHLASLIPPELPRPNIVEFEMYPESVGLIIGRRGHHLEELQQRSGAGISFSDPVHGLPRRVSVWGSEAAVASALHRIFGKLNSSGQPFLPVPRPNRPDKELREDFEWILEIASSLVLAERTHTAIEDSTGVKIALGAPENGRVRLKLSGKPVPLHYAIAQLHSHLGPGIITEYDANDEPVIVMDDLPPYHSEWADVYSSRNTHNN
jgi:KH domain